MEKANYGLRRCYLADHQNRIKSKTDVNRDAVHCHKNLLYQQKQIVYTGALKALVYDVTRIVIEGVLPCSIGRLTHLVQAWSPTSSFHGGWYGGEGQICSQIA